MPTQAAERRLSQEETVLTVKERAFARANPLEALAMVQVGFELEVQRFMGRRYSDISNQMPSVLNQESYKEAVRNSIKNDVISNHRVFYEYTIRLIYNHDWQALCDLEYIKNVINKIAEDKKMDAAAVITRVRATQDSSQSSRAEARNWLSEALNQEHYNFTAYTGPKFTEKQLIKYLEDQYSSMRSYIQNYVREHDHYVADPRYAGRVESGHVPFVTRNQARYFELIARNWHPKLTYCSDASVQGPEIKPSEPVSVAEAGVMVDALFNNDITVDTGCSFHVHVSLKNDQGARYQRALQLYMIEYVLSNLDQIPETCRARWMNQHTMARYFSIKPTAEKYAFVAFRDHLRTWEFRCFGNITNAEDAKLCIKLAANAYHYATRRLIREEKSLVIKRPSSRAFKVVRETLAAVLEAKKPNEFKKVFKQKDKEDLSARGKKKFSADELNSEDNRLIRERDRMRREGREEEPTRPRIAMQRAVEMPTISITPRDLSGLQEREPTHFVHYRHPQSGQWVIEERRGAAPQRPAQPVEAVPETEDTQF